MKEYRTKEIYGDFYENEGKPLVVIIAGSRPGLPLVSEKLMDYLIPDYNVLRLAYYGVPGLSESLENVPLEYFINAANFIKENYKVADNKVIFIGCSKGGEAALLLTKYMESAVTIACVASCYVFQGLPNDLYSMSQVPPKSSWSFNNKELPYIKFEFDEDDIEDTKNQYFCKIHEKSIEKNFNQEVLINIDNYKGKIFLLSSENDRYWPSKKMSNMLNSKNKNNVKHVCLNLEGHGFLNYDESVNEMIQYLEEIKQA
ncbi:acyl-CoA thioester hydrolase/BAAT C-terminal domain-containing protein [Clostridium scatologenes]|uniref:BAAT/Acyl-CoA thioester hydrolase n=1 Tax=Clostridium scatologenes TaxID=1548 RepID=A0A0E3GRM0_CLOSL|nr:acyl-CoA thioester hydrolase/BAAT C-terminal domain-containing protein [Clostridium scatologenes]AKA70556.1 BAAT/Acyl-CoA thioester hydrolase [Clostridium scatologenes]